ncbi:MAG: GNAT family N-acetyltransferase [Candidatus Muiribacteriota bacterium]
MNIELAFFKKQSNKFQLKEVFELYLESGWWGETSDEDINFIQKILTQSFIFCGIFKNKKIVGMGRAISDGVSDAYIQDIYVKKEYRKRGYGSFICKSIIFELKKNNIDWIGLIGEPGTEKFYNNLGFEEMKNYIPMILK